MPRGESSTNAQRTAHTRGLLLAAARTLFMEAGFAAASTPELVKRAGLTRGALYHHFADKREILRAVIEGESRQVADEIANAAPTDADPIEALRSGSIAYLDAMAIPGRTRLLLVEGPASLGLAEMTAIDETYAAATLLEGLQAALPGRDVIALASLLAAAFDRAALEIDGGADADAVRSAMLFLIDRVTAPGP